MNQDKEVKRPTRIRQHFPKPTLQHWLDLAHKELGSGKSLDSLHWNIEEDIVIEPLPRSFHRTQKSLTSDQKWQLAETYRLPLSEADQNTITSQELGEIILLPDEIDLSSVAAPHANTSMVLQTIKAPEIGLIPSWIRFVKIEALDPLTLKILEHANFEWRYATADHSAPPSFQVAEIAEQLISFLRYEDEKSVAPGRYRIYISISDRYLGEIAKIRALRVVLFNLWHALKLDISTLPKIYCEISTIEQDQNVDLIKSSAKAMAATIAGADFLYFSTNPLVEQSSEYFRLKRNIYSILKYESHMHHRLDPLAGSHLIEEMTQKIADKAWKKVRGTGR